MDSLTFLYIHDILEKLCGRVLPVFKSVQMMQMGFEGDTVGG